MATSQQQLPDDVAEALRDLLNEVANARPDQQVTESMVDNAQKAKGGLVGGSLIPGLI
jgi:tartrate dehydratase alpha subunit/fumarate hydratase class I-like protein